MYYLQKMNNLVKTGIRKLHNKLGEKLTAWDKEPSESENALPYRSLSPIGNADVASYVEALEWALKNCKKEEIYNIALTGPYGSGKSSILKTFKEQNTDKQHVFLEISLATFKEELDESENPI
ncbi:MAG: ATP-binding protein, partial [Pedobacter sp.]